MPELGLFLIARSESLISNEILVKAGGAAGAVALLGILLVLPLYLNQRREVQRLLLWREREPHRGDEGEPTLFTETETEAQRPGATGEMSPAERVTADRPALERITSERPALVTPSFWKRLIARGPRHPLVLSLLAVFIAVAVVAAVVLGIGGVDQGGGDGSGGLDRGAVDVVILNGSSEKDLADRVSSSVSAAGFTQIRTGRTGASKQTLVLHAPGQQRAAKVLAKRLAAGVVQPLKNPLAAAAPGADVVVVAGEDRARA